MIPADEFDIRWAATLRFFNHIEDDVVHRIAEILEANWTTIHLLIEDLPFTGKIATYKKALNANSEKSFPAELDRDFWKMMDDLRIVRNSFAHGTQYFLQSENGGVQHVYARAAMALAGKFEQAIAFEAMAPTAQLATHLHLLMRCFVMGDGPPQSQLLTKAKKDWLDLKLFLPAGRSAKWPPRN